ncbi:uncharacterized protein LOC106649087 [Trichogramma pretiosum]|uniref:uncharacterized protein LOC106649087 n=1 Tax=Trichogramma pretiosum TaxID=7493 RepID=UPI000C71921A|nr:uncharacterized protein LOC106649087 [Trichogramma pretiosum]
MEEKKKRSDEDAKCNDSDKRFSVKCIKFKIESFVRTASAQDVYNVSESVQIVKKKEATASSSSLLDALRRFANSHVLKIKLSDANELAPRMFFGSPALGQNTFLTGFGLGFLAFGIKKLLLPLFIGVQIVKSILIALFLPSIIGSLGKIVGKSVTSFAQSSHSPGLGGAGGQPQYDDQNYEFKDQADAAATAYGEDYMARQPLGTLPASAMYDESMLQQTTKSPAEIASRFAYVGMNDQSYSRIQAQRYQQAKRQDYKVFQEIPTSSLMLTNYDPFYSPLLSRLDAVFSRLGHDTEGCREYAVCAMYRSPARYAPYSNLVSAQLSRELNELRKPSGDNPDVLRFFRYMKAAKDGQDGVACEAAYADCDEAKGDQTIRQNQAMLATYQDIDKLVHARKL